jgi:hypothetical protein
MPFYSLDRFGKSFAGSLAIVALSACAGAMNSATPPNTPMGVERATYVADALPIERTTKAKLANGDLNVTTLPTKNGGTVAISGFPTSSGQTITIVNGPNQPKNIKLPVAATKGLYWVTLSVNKMATFDGTWQISLNNVPCKGRAEAAYYNKKWVNSDTAGCGGNLQAFPNWTVLSPKAKYYVLLYTPKSS